MYGPGTQVFSSRWNGSPLLLSDPEEILVAHDVKDVRFVLRQAAAAASRGYYAAGYVAYEAAPAFEPAVPQRPAIGPLAWMAVYDRVRDASLPTPTQAGISNWTFGWDEQGFRDRVEAILHYIREGDVYQINLTGPIHFELVGDAYDLYQTLLARQPVPFAAFIDTGDEQILSWSPELFFERQGDLIRTKPMKGTARRGTSSDEDDAIADWLSRDAKSRAENLMIVDLLRNDLSRVCAAGSVEVTSLFATERYETLIQMTSEIHGRLLPGLGTSEIFEALFPCGSVTGAPKIRAMHRIQELEPTARGIYCGAVGFMRGDRAVFNVAIRTAVVRERRGVLGVGSGIVWDSNPGDELEECLLKGRFLTDCDMHLRIIETMRSDDGTIPLLELHVTRLMRSAAFFGFPVDPVRIRERIREVAGLATGSVKVRLTLGHGGDEEIVVSPAQTSAEWWTATISDERILSSDPYRRHKTTRREMYEVEHRKALAAGYDEVLFLNEKGQLAEGSRSNIVVVRGNSWWTPPVESGALPGVYRQHLLRTRTDLRERVLYIDDLLEASDIYLCNALMGLVRAHVVIEAVDVHPQV